MVLYPTHRLLMFFLGSPVVSSLDLTCRCAHAALGGVNRTSTLPVPVFSPAARTHARLSSQCAPGTAHPLRADPLHAQRPSRCRHTCSAPSCHQPAHHWDGSNSLLTSYTYVALFCKPILRCSAPARAANRAAVYSPAYQATAYRPTVEKKGRLPLPDARAPLARAPEPRDSSG